MKFSQVVLSLAALASLAEASCSSGKTHKKQQHRLSAAKIKTSSNSTIVNPKNRNATLPSNSTGLTGLNKNQIYLGFVPDEGDAGGQRQTMAQLNSLVSGKAATYGWYVLSWNPSLFKSNPLLFV